MVEQSEQERVEQRRKRNREYMRKYRERYPEKEHAAQVRKALNLLVREGYTILKDGTPV